MSRRRQLFARRGATLSADEETRMAEPPDWRLQQTERALNRLERQGFAWEFLRRNPDYPSEYDSLRSTPTSRPGDASRQRSTAPRSEEHTSELQSLMRISYAVFCLKKQKKIQ